MGDDRTTDPQTQDQSAAQVAAAPEPVVTPEPSAASAEPKAEQAEAAPAATSGMPAAENPAMGVPQAPAGAMPSAETCANCGNSKDQCVCPPTEGQGPVGQAA